MTLRRALTISRQSQLHQLAQQYAREVLIADDLPEAHDIARTVKPDLVILDDFFNTQDIHRFVTTTDNLYDRVHVVIVSDSEDGCFEPARLTETSLVHRIKYGDNEALERIIHQIDTPSTDNERNVTTDFFLNDLAASVTLAGQSTAAKNLLGMIEMVGSSRCNPALIVGETGTGKEVAARAIHNTRCPKEPFVAVNCAALTANLLESELFGHVKGSFTSADRDKIGLMELAGKGTLFLDEISEMPLNLQAKLLRILQEKTFRKVGGTKTISCNALIIASSNRNLLAEVQHNRFRRDLYYRLSVCPITIEPLRSNQRKQDIKLLAEYFLSSSDIHPQKSAKIKSLTPLAIEALEKHDWPGNVRELRNVIERAILLEQKDRIGLGSIAIEHNEITVQPNSSTSKIGDFSLAKAECELIARALRETGWQKTKAAALLGITRATLYAKVKQYNIKKEAASNHKATQTATPYSTAVAVC
ncbi:MAG: sigma-54-dependent Fis family transcriptional regulator [Phycisphaerales bacterium]|jgi:transcriptional regulator with PAS, ATPase and Fis domain